MVSGMEPVSLSPPLLTLAVAERLITAQDRAEPRITLSLDLGKSTVIVEPGAEEWKCPLGAFPYPFGLKDRTVYAWSGSAFEAVSVLPDAARQYVRSADAAGRIAPLLTLPAAPSGTVSVAAHPTLRLGSIYEAPDLLFSQAERIQGDYPKVVNELLPAQLQPQLNPLRGYARDPTIVAPAVADDPDLARAIEAIRARRLELLPLARNEVAATTARWYALKRLSNEMRSMLDDLKQWDQATRPLEEDLEECRTSTGLSVRQRMAVEAAAAAGR